MNVDLTKMTEKELRDLREEADSILTKNYAENNEIKIKPGTINRLKKKLRKFIKITSDDAPYFGKLEITVSVPIQLECEGEMYLKYHDEAQLFDVLSEDKLDLDDLVENDAKIQKKFKAIDDEYKAFVAELRSIADKNEVQMYEVWDLVDPECHWH